MGKGLRVLSGLIAGVFFMLQTALADTPALAGKSPEPANTWRRHRVAEKAEKNQEAVALPQTHVNYHTDLWHIGRILIPTTGSAIHFFLFLHNKDKGMKTNIIPILFGLSSAFAAVNFIAHGMDGQTF